MSRWSPTRSTSASNIRSIFEGQPLPMCDTNVPIISWCYCNIIIIIIITFIVIIKQIPLISTPPMSEINVLMILQLVVLFVAVAMKIKKIANNLFKRSRSALMFINARINSQANIKSSNNLPLN